MQNASAAILDGIAARRNTVVTNNIDSWRFPGATAIPVPPEMTAMVAEFVRANAARIDKGAALFADDASRELLCDLFAFHAHGPLRVKLGTNTPRYWKAYADARHWRTADVPESCPPFEFSAFRAAYKGHDIDVHCWLGNVVFSFIFEQYTFSRPETARIACGEGYYVIDGGMCFGDTALGFSALAGPKGRIFGFEPIPSQRAITTANCERNPELGSRVDISARALADIAGRELRFSDAGAGSRAAPDGTVSATTTTIDEFVGAEALSRVDLIKMDIEGAEPAALNGAAKTIRDFRPTLAISAYHHPSHLFELLLQIRDIEPRYKFYLDHYTVHTEETILFAVPA